MNSIQHEKHAITSQFPVTNVSSITARLESVRQELRQHQADALLVPSSDPHLSEYLPEHWAGRKWLSGFTGSTGTLVVTLQGAQLFADSRYWESAERQLGSSGIELVRIVRHGPAHERWLAENIRSGGTVMADGACLSLGAAEFLRQNLQSSRIKLRTDKDLLELVWGDRPGLPSQMVYRQKSPFVVRDRVATLQCVRDAMHAVGATHHLVSTLDDIAWITNLRGNDIEFNPFFIAHLLIAKEHATLFIVPGKVDADILAELAKDGIHITKYDKAMQAIGSLTAGSRLMLDRDRISLLARASVPDHVEVIEQINPSTLAKSVKTQQELTYFKQAILQDGLAFCRFYAEFESSRKAGKSWGEYDVHEALTRQRAASVEFVSPSFMTSAGFNANGANPHYSPTAQEQTQIVEPGLLLIDSGAQYHNGTTDVTRVWPIGTPTAAHQLDYTLVLKCLIALSRARFPRGTPGPKLDAIARSPLWAESLDCSHGIGHGVGYFLGVHEGPQYISGLANEHSALDEGMVLTIEPGLYRQGQWGVRLENMLVTVAAPQAGFGDFLQFETLTLCPIDTTSLDRSMLDSRELEWLNGYHQKVRSELAPHLDGDALNWLIRHTELV